MRMKRVTSMFAAVVMVLSLMAGFSFAPKAVAATVDVNLPEADGIYFYDWVPYDWDAEKVNVGTDKNGNEILLDGDQPMEYRDQNGWYLEEDNIKNGYGPGIELQGELWFDYVTGGKKVTHIPFNKLKFTHLDGTPCDDFVVSKWANDSRAVTYVAGKDEPVLVTYTGAKKNNKMVICPVCGTGFYSAPTKSVETYLSNREWHPVLKGKSKDFYLILEKDEESEDGILIDLDSMLSIRYWDKDKQQEVSLTEAADVKKIATATLVSDSADVKKKVVKITVTAPENIEDFWIRAGFRGFNINNPSETWHEWDPELQLTVVEGNTFEGSYDNTIGFKNGKLDVVEKYSFGVRCFYDSVVGVPLYAAFKYTDADGNQKFITDENDLTLYGCTYDEENNKYTIGDRIAGDFKNLVQVTRPNPDSPVFKIVVTDLMGMGYCQLAAGYKDIVPDPNKGIIRIGIHGEINGDPQMFSSKKANLSTRINDVSTDGTKALTVYYAANGDYIKSITFKKCELIDESGKDLGGKVKVKDANMVFDGVGPKSYGSAITIPAGVLTSGARLQVCYEIEDDRGEKWDNWKTVLVEYNAPKKGTKITSGGVTYKVTAKNAVSVSKVKASAKSVTIPAKVGALKVTGIAAKAMKGCKKLTKITVKSTTIKTVGKGAFTGVPAKAKAKVPKAKKSAYTKLFKKGGFKGKVK